MKANRAGICQFLYQNLAYLKGHSRPKFFCYLLVLMFFAAPTAHAYVSPEGCLMAWRHGWQALTDASLQVSPTEIVKQACQVETSSVCSSGEWAHCEAVSCTIEADTEMQIRQSMQPYRNCTGRSVIARLQVAIKPNETGHAEEQKSVAVQIQSEPYCEQCAHYCPESFVFNEGSKRCEAPKLKTLPRASWAGSNSIDYNLATPTDAGHVRYQHLVVEGAIPLWFFYSNYAHTERTITGYIPEKSNVTEPVRTTKPFTYDAYIAQFDGVFGLSESDKHLPNSALGDVTQYWRHEYDAVLRRQNDEWVFDSALGPAVTFDIFGMNKTMPQFSLIAHETENGTSEHHVRDSQYDRIYVFDDSGLMIRSWQADNGWIRLSYDEKNRLKSLSNQHGDWVEFSYRLMPTRRVTAVEAISQAYIRKISTSEGKQIRLVWQHHFSGRYAAYHLLTEIKHKRTRRYFTRYTFDYDDERWPESLTSIYQFYNGVTPRLQRAFEFGQSGNLALVLSSITSNAAYATVSPVSGD